MKKFYLFLLSLASVQVFAQAPDLKKIAAKKADSLYNQTVT